MAIRKNTNPRAMDLQPEMRDILMRNGMQAHIVPDGAGYSLVVQGHDSPLLAYPITERQMLALTDWGTNTANKKAYNVFTSIVGNDFYMPKDFVHARNANGRVAMGLHGYRIGIGEYGRTGWRGLSPAQGRRAAVLSRPRCRRTLGRDDDARRAAIRRFMHVL